jgi:hypothetical protein
VIPNNRRFVFWFGLALYVASFFLPSIVNFNGPVPGWASLQATGLIALIEIKDLLHGDPPVLPYFEIFSVFVVALINPIFWIYAAASLFRPQGPVVLISRILVPFMIPFCWVIFHYQWFRPREGHFVWILGMLLVLASGYSVHRPSSPIGQP